MRFTALRSEVLAVCTTCQRSLHCNEFRYPCCVGDRYVTARADETATSTHTDIRKRMGGNAAKPSTTMQEKVLHCKKVRTEKFCCPPRQPPPSSARPAGSGSTPGCGSLTLAALEFRASELVDHDGLARRQRIGSALHGAPTQTSDEVSSSISHSSHRSLSF